MSANAIASFLFCDLVGSTALLTRLGDDAGDDVRRRCYGVFREAVAEHRGTEVKSTGDGLLVLFSVSVGDAIGCGIAMHRGIARLHHDNPLLGLGLRVGVAVGEAASEEGDWIALEELSVACGPDGHTVGLGDSKGNVAIVDTKTGKKSLVIRAHDNFVESISFARDLATFVTAGRDGTIKLWDAHTGQLLGGVQPLGSNRIVRAKFVDASRVLIYFSTGEIFAWDPRPGAWEAYGCRVAGRNLSKAEWAELLPGRPYRSTCPEYAAGT